ncbi:MAG TPA: HPP family protein [Aliiroseovarius sp.]|nr:HPP family protein [Aliiroseovarius sp.]
MNLDTGNVAGAHREKLVYGLGGGVAIFVVFAMTRQAELSLHPETELIASLGASAVLLFAAPRGPKSQPWNVIGGHMISALIGGILHQAIADTTLACTLAAKQGRG